MRSSARTDRSPLEPRRATILRTSLITLTVLWCASVGVDARASLVVGNLTAPGTFGGLSTSSDSSYIAEPFTLGPSFTPIGLQSITLPLYSLFSDSTAHVTLWSDSGTLPASQVADLGTLAVPQSTNPVNYSFSPQSAFTLQASTNYWVVLTRSAGAGELAWKARSGPGHALDPGSDPAADIPPDVTASSADSGATWNSGANELYIAVHSVPAPATTALLGLVTLGHFRRRKITPESPVRH